MASHHYFAEQTLQKFGLQEKSLIQVFDTDFPYPIANFLAENNTLEAWLITQNQKNDTLKMSD